VYIMQCTGTFDFIEAQLYILLLLALLVFLLLPFGE
jgi:hypothetical protein